MKEKKIDNVNFEYGSKFLHLYVIQKNYKCDNPNYPPIHVFTLMLMIMIFLSCKMSFH
jgi:hypothetical protein